MPQMLLYSFVRIAEELQTISQAITLTLVIEGEVTAPPKSERLHCIRDSLKGCQLITPAWCEIFSVLIG